mmetsp:Transcript_32464/g.85468  ORF Transcript_32464/g.85468 Transcript_32464/m.85468 type:complete len:206 (-) Transcript_32464:3650-4267(-)
MTRLDPSIVEHDVYRALQRTPETVPNQAHVAHVDPVPMHVSGHMHTKSLGRLRRQLPIGVVVTELGHNLVHEPAGRVRRSEGMALPVGRVVRDVAVGVWAQRNLHVTRRQLPLLHQFGAHLGRQHPKECVVRIRQLVVIIRLEELLGQRIVHRPPLGDLRHQRRQTLALDRVRAHELGPHHAPKHAHPAWCAHKVWGLVGVLGRH